MDVGYTVGFDFQAEVCPFAMESITTFGPNPVIRKVPGDLSPRIMRPGRENYTS
jgi:hypothetical protein